MIQVTCPGCHSRLKAKESLAGQIRHCPKCHTPVMISHAAETLEKEAHADQPPAGAQAEIRIPRKEKDSLPPIKQPPVVESLDRQHRYLICDNKGVVAAWQNDGHGWMLHTRTGKLSAVRYREKIPTAGTFTLVELKLETTGAGLRLQGLIAYELADRWALTNLDRGDDRVLTRISDYGSLNRDQKDAVRSAIKEQFMPDVWQDARDVLDYLGNRDYHSPGPG